MTRAFLDSNVLLYAFTSDAKAIRAKALLKLGGIISVQVLNEFANVARRKLQFEWDEARAAISVIRLRCATPVPLTLALHADGLRLAQRYQLSIYDGLIVAAALSRRCDLLWSEDMQSGMVFDGRLRIVNPFAPTA